MTEMKVHLNKKDFFQQNRDTTFTFFYSTVTTSKLKVIFPSGLWIGAILFHFDFHSTDDVRPQCEQPY